ncbi:hypothetical protein [Tabrizicola sp.]|uniref:hypothetical protein n=1 Tax=Tabrizicola sp. TaxID=2005166 RepID=UPI00286CDCAD|nr:hypothetical protein [Tabrizicola sp.]
MQVPEWAETEEHWFRYGEGNNASLIDGAEVAASDIDDFLNAMGSANATWDVDISGMFGPGDATGHLWYTPPGWNGGPDDWDAWFVAGGAVDGTSLDGHAAPHATMPDDPANPVSDWLLAA